MNIINYLKGVSNHSWNIENIIKETINILNSMENYHISNVYHESNVVEDSIANVAVRCDERMTWEGNDGLPRIFISSIDYDIINGKERVVINKNGSS